MRRVLIISHAFLPQYGMGPLRIGKLAKYLPEFDYLPLVLAGGNGKNDASWVFRPPLPNVVAWAKRLLPGPTQAQDRGEKAASSHRPLRKEVRGWWPPSEVRMPDKYLYWIIPAIGLGLQIIKRYQPDIIFSSSGPPSSAIAASILQKLSGLPWVAEFRDLWSKNPYEVRTPGLQRLDEFLEARVLSNASFLVSVSEPLTRQLAADHGKPAFVVYNGFDEDDYPAIMKVSDNFIISYTGTIYWGKQDLHPLFKALKVLFDQGKISAKTFRMRFYGPDIAEQVTRVAKQYGIPHLCELNEPISHQDCLYRQCESDILLLLGWNDPGDKGVATGKLFEYLGAGRPILGLGYPYGVMADILRETGSGVVLNDPTEIADYIFNQVKARQTQSFAERVVQRSPKAGRFTHRAAAQEMARIFNQAIT